MSAVDQRWTRVYQALRVSAFQRNEMGKYMPDSVYDHARREKPALFSALCRYLGVDESSAPAGLGGEGAHGAGMKRAAHRKEH